MTHKPIIYDSIFDQVFLSDDDKIKGGASLESSCFA